jgi:hypothetical protein
MFNNHDDNILMLEGAYKKLKSYYYYDKTLLYIKYKIAEFEYSQDLFIDAFNQLSKSLINKDVEYFTGLINQCSFRVLPKNMNTISSNSDVLRTDVDRSKDVAQLNYFIDAPIELLILDALWMLHISKIAKANNLISSYSYAGKYKNGLFNTYDKFGIEFESNRCFEPYFSQYSKWRNNAFTAVEEHQTCPKTLK